MNILLFSHRFNPDIGGIESISEMLANHFSKCGHKVHVVTWTLCSEFSPFAFEVVRKPSYIQLFKEFLWADIIFENNPCLRLSWPNLIFNKPSIISLQTWFSQEGNNNSILSKLKIIWLSKADNVVACSKIIQEICFPKALVINNPYDNSAFYLIPSVERNLDFVFLGRLVSDKGASLAVEAFHKITENSLDYKNLTLTIIGDGPERIHLEKLTKDLGINQKVVFSGSLKGEALAKCLNQHRFLIVPSIWKEPFGIVALEGMACGCLPIVSDASGLSEAVGNAGLLFARNDLNALVKCIQNILTNHTLEMQLRSAAPSHLTGHHQATVAEKYLDVIEEAFNHRH